MLTMVKIKYKKFIKGEIIIGKKSYLCVDDRDISKVTYKY